MMGRMGRIGRLSEGASSREDGSIPTKTNEDEKDVPLNLVMMMLNKTIDGRLIDVPRMEDQERQVGESVQKRCDEVWGG